MTGTGIEWTDVTWNPVRGCRRVSPGCLHCYAELQARRMDHPGTVEGNGAAPQRQKAAGAYYGLTVVGGDKRPRWNGLVREAPEVLEQPLRWQKHRRVFVGSMSDLFYERFDPEWVAAVLGVMVASPHLTFQVLTKRPEHMAGAFANLTPRDCVQAAKRQIGGYHAKLRDLHVPEQWPLPNVWIGTSVEDVKRLQRVAQLLEIPAAVHWVSAEPLLEELDLTPYLTPRTGPRLRWVVAGGESGRDARACEIEWLQLIVDDCAARSTPCYVKQVGSNPRVGHPGMSAAAKPRAGTWPLAGIKHRRGGNPDEWPESLRVRQFPRAQP